MDDLSPAPRASLAALVASALAEDVGEGDWTTQWTVPEDARCRAQIVAKEPLVVAGVDPVLTTFAAVDPGLRVTVLAAEGSVVDQGGVLFAMEGATRSVLTAERTALNFLGHLSGVATLTRRFVRAVEGTGATVIDTRKTTPGWRALEKAAVRAGGGSNHRAGLYDMVLVKDNHAAAAGGVAEAARRTIKMAAGRFPVEVEVSNLEELDAVLPLGADRLLLDNMTPAELSAAVARATGFDGERPELEASGNVTLETVHDVAMTGVDLISVGALTHSAPSADVSLRVIG